MIKNVGIIGAGTMGSGIAQVAATADCKVKIFDLNQDALDKAKTALEKILNRLIEKGRIDAVESYRAAILKGDAPPETLDRLATLESEEAVTTLR